MILSVILTENRILKLSISRGCRCHIRKCLIKSNKKNENLHAKFRNLDGYIEEENEDFLINDSELDDDSLSSSDIESWSDGTDGFDDNTEQDGIDDEEEHLDKNGKKGTCVGTDDGEEQIDAEFYISKPGEEEEIEATVARKVQETLDLTPLKELKERS